MKATVIHRAKHDKNTRHKTIKTTVHPAMKELSRMIEAGEVHRGRTIAYLEKGQQP
ncbi:MAG: hypothetical protein PHR77_13645 [Kiritimatiellae bacterium]|nr:hypothetical protein [Kiritimatiellia bacterium]MDD5520732.1 hypothetical protein [Kiritimatiellia bacterium]